MGKAGTLEMIAPSSLTAENKHWWGQKQSRWQMINLILAFIWLGFAVFVFAAPHFNPQARPLKIPGTEISMGWFALVFFLYNVIRWWTTPSRLERRPFLPAPPDSGRREDEQAAPDSNFNFSDKPLGPPQKGQGPGA
jgi:hypothetical protein